MRITSRGRVTIPTDIRRQAGLVPGTEVQVEFGGSAVRIALVEASRHDSRGRRLVAHLRGRGDIAMSTDAIMVLTRGE